MFQSGWGLVAVTIASITVAMYNQYRVVVFEKELEKERVKRNDERAGRTKAERELTEKVSGQ